MQQGMIHLYVGDGKGKTTAAVGLCVRMAGAGGRVVFAQFLKDARSHEREILSRLPEVTLVPVPERVKFTARMTPEERAEAAAFWAQTLETAFALAQDAALLVLDEALDAARKGFFPKERLLRLLGARYDRVLGEALSARLGRPMTVRLLHDGTAGACGAQGAYWRHEAFIGFGTSLSVGFPCAQMDFPFACAVVQDGR